MTDYVELVQFIVRNIVDNPDAVVVESHPGRGRAETIEIGLDPTDVGRVIGKGGRNIEAIRAVVKAAAIKEHHRVNVEVIADELPLEGDSASATETEPAEAEPAESPGVEEPVADGPVTDVPVPETAD